MKYRWTIAPPQPALVSVLTRELNVSDLLAQCLLNRGLTEPEPIARFLQPRLQDLADPFLLPNMGAAVDTIQWLRDRGVDVLVLDHHQISHPAPAATALVNPAGARFSELCSAGLAFKLAHALLKQARATGLPGAAELDLRRHLDLVAL